MARTTLPQELSDQILEQLYYDVASLKHCSLVCRSWLFSSHIQLFQKLTFTSENTPHLAALIPRSNIPQYVKRLEFRGVKTPCPDPQLLGHFTSRVTHLQFRDITFNNFPYFLDIICAFPFLQSLCLDDVTWTDPSLADHTMISHRALAPSVVHLRLYRIPLRSFSRWLMLHQKLPSVPRLEIGPIEEQDVPYAGKYMSLIGPALQHISFSFGYGENGHICLVNTLRGVSVDPNTDKASIAYRYWKVFGVLSCTNLSTFTSLRTLRIDGFLDSSARHQTTALFWAPRVFASIRSYNLNHVVISVTLARAGELDCYHVNWEFFDEALTSEGYANLRSVEFEIHGRANMDGAVDLISLRLPAVAKRGLLRFSRPV